MDKKKNLKETSMKNLPDDVQKVIVSKVDRKTAARLATTSKKMKSLVQETHPNLPKTLNYLKGTGKYQKQYSKWIKESKKALRIALSLEKKKDTLKEGLKLRFVKRFLKAYKNHELIKCLVLWRKSKGFEYTNHKCIAKRIFTKIPRHIKNLMKKKKHRDDHDLETVVMNYVLENLDDAAEFCTLKWIHLYDDLIVEMQRTLL
jgi:F-box domain